MRKLMVTRSYNLADAVLKQKADEFINLLDRDSAEFADRGYDAAAKTNFETARDAVSTFLSDETNEAKYNDYVIYNTPSGMPEEAPI